MVRFESVNYRVPPIHALGALVAEKKSTLEILQSDFGLDQEQRPAMRTQNGRKNIHVPLSARAASLGRRRAA